MWALLFGVILIVLLPAVLLTDDLRLFLLKLFTAAVLATLPGWLYLQFIRNKGESLYDEYVINLFRLHIDEVANLPMPPEHTSYWATWKKAHQELGTETLDNLYRRKFEGVYGRSSVSTRDAIYESNTLRDKTETFSPVLVATLLLCLGWVLIFQPEPINVFGRPVARSGEPLLPFKALEFGFLGSYLYIVLDLLGRYFREDLKTAAYISAATRIVIVTVIVTAADVIWSGNLSAQENVASFFIGMFPDVGLQAMRAFLAKPLRRVIPSLKSERPLSEIHGLSFWYEARLAEEGISDIQNLTSANLIDLLLRSRVPVSRLIDWLDQGFLHLHLPTTTATRRRWRDMLKMPQPYRETRARFQAIGVRTATDLERAWSALGNDKAFQSSLAEAFGSGIDAATAVARTKVILRSLKGEVNLRHVRAFKKGEWLDGDGGSRAPSTNGAGKAESGAAGGETQQPVGLPAGT